MEMEKIFFYAPKLTPRTHASFPMSRVKKKSPL
jgi:hypothetical protein